MERSEQPQGFWLGEWRVTPGLSEIQRHGHVIQLEPKVMAVLILLASRPGEVFSRQELEASVWDTVIGYDALAKAINKLREALGDDKKQPRYIQTIPKKGYRLVAPITTDAQSPQTESGIDWPARRHADNQSHRWRRYLTISLPFAILIAGILVFFAAPGDRHPEKNTAQIAALITKPTIVVLPFRNISPDDNNDYLADGLTSDLTTSLSKLSSLWVTASNAALVYKDIQVTPERLRQELQARYMLSGDVNKLAQTIRINVHLTDLENGNILWSDRYNRKFTDLFAIQDEVTSNIITSLSITLTEEEQRRIASRYTNNLQAYDFFLRGRALINIRTPEANESAREMYRQAIILDSNFARAYAGLAMTYAVGYVSQWKPEESEDLEMAMELSSRAIEMDRDLPESYFVSGFINGYYGNTRAAIEDINKALSLNPNYADAYTLLAWNYIAIGEPQRALDYMTHALHLNPTGGYLYLMQIGKANYFLENYDLALTYFEKAREGNPVFINTIYYLTATYASLGRLGEASWVMGEMKHTFPNFNIETWLSQNGIQDELFQEKLRRDLLKVQAHMQPR